MSSPSRVGAKTIQPREPTEPLCLLQRSRVDRAVSPEGVESMRNRLCVVVSAFGLVVAFATPAFACGGLIGPNGAVNLTRTTTLAAFHDGVEHYITAFNYAGGGGAFGSIVPLPAMPSKVEKGGDWTLQRLLKETAPREQNERAVGVSALSGDSAREVYKTR